MKKEILLINWLKALLVLILVLLVFGFALQKINFATADIGRHLINGKLLVEQKTLVSTNYYSYTMQNQLVTNHHWLSGVIFYLVFQLAGFSGLSVFYAVLLSIAFTFFFFIGKRQARWWSLILTTVLFLPLIGLRSEVRPEAFSLVFLGLETWWLLRIMEKKQFKWWVWLVFGFIQVLWVNLHLFFFLSWAVVGAMLIQQWLQKNKPAIKFLLILLGVVVVASFISPFGYKSVIEPFFILQDFGYQLAENQTLFFMIKRFGMLQYWHGLTAVILGLGTCGYLIWRYNSRHLFATILLISFSVFAFFMNRFVPMLGFMLIGFGSWVVGEWLVKNQFLEKSLTPFLSVFLLLVFISTRSYLSPFRSSFGIGLLPGAESSAAFFKQHNLSGPIFNNYDIGGYLIYQLFPGQRVFIDNRPEAYSPEFFKRYIKAQEDEAVWQELDQEYGFETIFFYRHDFTPWAQPFLIKRIEDEVWVGVYVDNFVLILVRDDEKNQQVIKEFSLPKEIFTIN
ncbi:glycosyltransferase family 39 protein [Patescibacteria group bacterium]|nr:glycosyltransferase family 39 protein [Patescibacteria group bacterium]MBU1885142.1 glycosyltransferase family 39 protein [Patescibacteria group bacterium]